MSEPVDLLLSDPGIVQARAVVEKLKLRGFLVFFNPQSGVSVVGCDEGKVPESSDIDEAYALHHEIGLLFAIQSLSNYYTTRAKACRAIELYRLGVNSNIS